VPAPESPQRFEPGRVRGVVFDLDGTLVDSYRAITESLNCARTAFGLDPLPVAQVKRRVGFGLEVLIAELVGPDSIDEGVRLFRERYGRIFASHTTALPGAADTLRALGVRGVRAAVASNKPARFSRPLLQSLGMVEGLSLVAGPDTSGATKPDPQMIRDCLAGMDVEPERAIYVGDMVLDVESGHRAGVEVVLVASGSADADELRRTGRPVLARLPELLDLI
jgi:2-phosphoglycolate phosphatase